MHSKPLKVLLVEDSPDDALILIRHIEKGGFDVDYQRVDSAREMRKALVDSTWDICISDHNMPGFDSTEALHLIKETGMDLPIVIVSGSIGEDIAVNAMKAGAHDYIMKDNLTRLVPAIERELRDAEERRARREAEEAIRFLAYHDSLTQLNNRNEFESRLRQALENAKHNQIQHTVLYLDLDQFKIINDTCGHIAGDELLKFLATKLKEQVREGDILARLGGDEFGVLLENCSLGHAQVIAEKILHTVKNLNFVWDGRAFGIGVSIGMVIIDKDSDGIENIMSAADMACYAAKEEGRNRIKLYREGDVEFSRRRGEMNWVGRISEALESDNFCLYKQPIKTVHSDHCHYEYLVRMQGDGNKLVLPDAFIPAAERYNLMPAIDQWVIENVLKHLNQLRRRGELLENEFHFINLSGASLDEKLLVFIDSVLEIYNIPANILCFEVTETAAISNLNVTLKFIQGCREKGIRFALDDFGTGFCSFSYLKTLPADFIKVDGGFVKNMLIDEIDCSVVESVIKVGHIAGLKTIAEYVETPEIMEKVMAMKVDYVQGFNIDKPMPIEMFE